MTTSPTSEQNWEQPNFTYQQARPYLSGPVLGPSQGPSMGPSLGASLGPVLLPIVTRVDVLPPPGPEEQRLNAVRALVWPITILVCILTGNWWPMLLLSFVVGAILKNRLRELRRQRYATAQLLR